MTDPAPRKLLQIYEHDLAEAETEAEWLEGELAALAWLHPHAVPAVARLRAILAAVRSDYAPAAKEGE